MANQLGWEDLEKPGKHELLVHLGWINSLEYTAIKHNNVYNGGVPLIDFRNRSLMKSRAGKGDYS